MQSTPLVRSTISRLSSNPGKVAHPEEEEVEQQHKLCTVQNEQFVKICLCTLGGYGLNQEGADKKAEDKLGKATKDSCKIVTEVLHGIMTQFVKKKLFNEHVKHSDAVAVAPAQVAEGAEPSKSTWKI